MRLPRGAADLFCHVSADKGTLYREILDAFAAARRQYRLQRRPDKRLDPRQSTPSAHTANPSNSTSSRCASSSGVLRAP